MMKIRKDLLPIILLLVGCTAQQNLQTTSVRAAKDYYISTSGNDLNPGTIAKPWHTIQKAAKTMVAGDTVFVRAGTYNNGISLTKSGTASAYITFQAYPGEQPVLRGSNWFGFSDYYSKGSSYIAIEGFEIIGGEFGIYFSKGGGNLIIRNNVVHGQTNAGISMNHSANGEIFRNIIYGIIGHNGFEGNGLINFIIHNNKAYNNNQNGIMVSHATTDTMIYGNRVYGNGCGTSQLYAGIAIEVSSEHNKVYNNLSYSNCHAGYLTNSSNNEIYNNVFYGNTEYQVLIGDWTDSIPENNIFENNVFVVTRSADHALGNFHSGTPYDALNNTYNYNAYYYINGSDKSDMIRLDSIYSFAKWKGIGNESKGLLADPAFVSSTDFSLNNSSPLIDAGSNLGSLVPIDFNGVIRPQGAGYDIGAYEVSILKASDLLYSIALSGGISPSNITLQS